MSVTKKSWSWATVATICATAAGIAGTVLTPLYGSKLATAVQAVLQALSGLFVLIPAIGAVHVSAVVNREARLSHIRLNEQYELHEMGATDRSGKN